MQAQHEYIATKPAKVQQHLVPSQAGCSRETETINCVWDTYGDLIDRLILYQGQGGLTLNVFEMKRKKPGSHSVYGEGHFRYSSLAVVAWNLCKALLIMDFTQEGQESWSLMADGSHSERINSRTNAGQSCKRRRKRPFPGPSLLEVPPMLKAGLGPHQSSLETSSQLCSEVCL